MSEEAAGISKSPKRRTAPSIVHRFGRGVSKAQRDAQQRFYERKWAKDAKVGVKIDAAKQA